MKNGKLTFEGVVCLFTLKYLWRKYGYVFFFGSAKEEYHKELLLFIGEHGEIYGPQVLEYRRSIENLMIKTSTLTDGDEILDRIPTDFFMIMTYDTILRLKKGYVMGDAQSVRQYFAEMKDLLQIDSDIDLELLNKIEEAFQPIDAAHV